MEIILKQSDLSYGDLYLEFPDGRSWKIYKFLDNDDCDEDTIKISYKCFYSLGTGEKSIGESIIVNSIIKEKYAPELYYHFDKNISWLRIDKKICYKILRYINKLEKYNIDKDTRDNFVTNKIMKLVLSNL